MVNLLCSLARNPDGSLVRPTTYEINAAVSNQLALAALGLLVILLLVGIMDYRIRSRRSMLVLSAVGIFLMALHLPGRSACPAAIVANFDRIVRG